MVNTYKNDPSNFGLGLRVRELTHSVPHMPDLCPLLYERSDLLIFLVPFVVSMVGGLVLSGVVTLFTLPVLVMAVEGAGGRAEGGNRG